MTRMSTILIFLLVLTTSTSSTDASTSLPSSAPTTSTILTSSPSPANMTSSSTKPTTSPSTVTTLKVIPYEGSCSADATNDQCKTQNASCINGICVCKSSRYYVPGKDSCEPLIPYEGSCSADATNDQCKTQNASCINGKCVCKSSRYYVPGKDSCEPLIPYEDSCSADATNEQCKTQNASCINEICICKSSRQYVPGKDSCELRPELPTGDNLKILDVTKNQFEVKWQESNVDGLLVRVKINPSNKENKTIFISSSEGNSALVIDNLTSGSLYVAEISVQRNNIISEKNYTKRIYTKIPYLGSCNASNIFIQCETQNASCIDKNCKCDSSRQYVQSEDYCVLRPALPPNSSFEIHDIQYHQFKVILTNESGDGLRVTVKINPSNNKNETTFLSTSAILNELIIGNLSSGTLYTAEIYVESNNITSKESYTRKIYTKPEALEPNEKRITKITENSITVLLEPNADKQCDKYLLQISSLHAEVVEPVELLRNASSLSHTFTELNESTMYTISISAIAGNWNATTTLSSYTLPKMINGADVLEQKTTYLKIKVYYDGQNSDKITYAITLMDSQDKNLSHTECGDETTENTYIERLDKSTFNISNLIPGTKYKMQIFSCINSESSVNFFPIDTYTKIAYREPCNETEIDEFCLTKDASCIDKICNCNSSRQYVPNHDTCALRPHLPSDNDLIVNNTLNHKIKIIWTSGISNKLRFFVKIKPSNTAGKDTFVSPSDTSNSLFIENLSSGALYILTIGVQNGNITSEKNYTRQIYTKPESLTVNERSVANITNNSITVSLNPGENKQCDKYLLQISSPGSGIYKTKELLRNNSSLLCEFSNLTESTGYKISIYVIAGNWRDNDTLPLSAYTLPKTISEAKVYAQRNSSLEILVDYDGHNSENISYAITLKEDLQVDNILQTSCEKNENGRINFLNDSTFEIIQLKAGTNYTIDIYSCFMNQSSIVPFTLSSFTRPETPTVEFINWKETSLSVEWKTEQSIKENVRLCIRLELSPNKVEFKCLSAFGNHTFENLMGGKLFTVTVSSFLEYFENDKNETIESDGKFAASHYTNPPPPSKDSISFDDIQTTFIDISVNNSKWHQYEFEFTPAHSNDTPSRVVALYSEFPVRISNLTIGTKYDIKVFSFVERIRSERNTLISTFTRPGNVRNIAANFTISNATSLTIQWKEPYEGDYSSFQITATCRSPNSGTNMSTAFSTNSKNTNAILSPLDPGTFCNASVYTVINNVDGKGNLISEGVRHKLNRSTDELAPEEVKLLGQVITATNLSIEWEKPLNPNGIIRQYKTFILDEKYNCTPGNVTYVCKEGECPINVDHHGCTGTDIHLPAMCNYTSISNAKMEEGTITQTTLHLHPYRNYSFNIQAFTKCWGKVSKSKLQTNISVPSKSPKGIEANTTESSITLGWSSLDGTDDANGPITKYTIYTTYNKTICSADDGVSTAKQNVSSNNTFDLINLRPYWIYSIKVSASTTVGEGPQSEEHTYITKESTPGPINSSNIEIQTDTNSANISWPLPCLQNGKLQKYEILVKYKNRNECCNITTASTPNAIIPLLKPYRNYTIQVRAYTSVGAGDYSKEKDFHTQIGVPEQPNNIKTRSESPTTISVTWEPPDEYTGPTYYVATAIDNQTSEVKICKTGYNFNATYCKITDLKAYRYYKVNVSANTDAGTKYSKHQNQITAQSTPGHVNNVRLVPEVNVTKPRSLQISWNKPLEPNGILTSYYVICNNTNDKRYIYGDNVSASDLSSVITGIRPGPYSVEVFAATEVGNGSIVSNITTIEPGAPIKVINETDGVLLMQPSAKQPSDKETQIAVQLPLDTFLCDNSNGDLKRWGVIVAQEGQANDKAFAGSVAGFRDKEAEYENWFNIKDMKSIPAYIATPKDWKANCPNVNDGNRRKRAIPQSPTDARFIVGDHGQCSGVKQNAYCNGQLQPGRSYRVKSFVCTDGGCTETEYSEPLSTVQRKLPAPDLTIPIAAGISSAVVVIAIVALTIFFLRRKQAACFSKDDESLTTHTPGEGIHLDKIEHTKKNHFRQGPVKLTDFPDAVERFHRDSDLLFADAYKMLKEKSPNHLMTAAEQQCCRPKNRYTNILPFDHSRVKLRPSDDIEGSDYINANYIPGYTSRREYIATQGPMQATFDDFWRMVWEQNVDTIVMLTKLMEKGRHKCDKYWPDLGEPVFYGDLVVSLQSESNLSDYTIMIFEIKMKEERKMVRHFSYLKWPDMGCPETPELLLEFVKAVKQYSNQEKNKSSTGPKIVHCSAGVGRTGTFIAVDYLLQHIRDHDEVDIFNLVLDMRNHRLNMVQTEDQYIYIHECLKAFITTDEEEEEDEEEEAVYVNTGFGADEENIYVNA